MDAKLPSLPTAQLSSFDDLVTNIRSFNHPLPTINNRISSIVTRSTNPLQIKAQVLSDALETRVIIHARVLPLIDEFLKIKIEFGSTIERKLYTGMSRDQFVKRLIVKRPLSFMYSNDETLGRHGGYIRDAERLWPLVGTPQ